LELDFQKNLGTTDRGIRVIIGLFLLGLVAVQYITGWWATIAVIFAVFQFIEAYFAY
jgi:hypothetical protein